MKNTKKIPNFKKEQSISNNTRTQNLHRKRLKIWGPNSLMRRFYVYSVDFMDKFAIMYLIATITSVFVLWLLMWLLFLPDKERDVISGFLVTILSVIIAPFTLSQCNKRASHRFKIAQENLSLYYELGEILISIIESESQETEIFLDAINSFIKNNKVKIALLFPSSITFDLSQIRIELRQKSISSAKSCSKRLLRKVRRQLDTQGKCYLPITTSFSATHKDTDQSEKVVEQSSEKERKVKK